MSAPRVCDGCGNVDPHGYVGIGLLHHCGGVWRLAEASQVDAELSELEAMAFDVLQQRAEECHRSDAALSLARADDELTLVQRIADKHLRGKIKGAARDAVVTLPVNDLLTITCAAASAQQAVRVASESVQ